jgi:hypothetical protein
MDTEKKKKEKERRYTTWHKETPHKKPEREK